MIWDLSPRYSYVALVSGYLFDSCQFDPNMDVYYPVKQRLQTLRLPL